MYILWEVDSTPAGRQTILRCRIKMGDLDRSIRNMKELAKMAQEYELILGMEVLNRHEGYLINTAKEGVAYVDAVGAENVKDNAGYLSHEYGRR